MILLFAHGSYALSTQPDSLVMHLGQKAAIPVLVNDSGTFVNASLHIVTPPISGSATVLSDGRIRYQQTLGTPASDQFTYQVADTLGVTSAPETVSITFSAQSRLAATTVNLPPYPPSTAYQVVDAFPGQTFSAPTTMDSAPGDTNRLFVGELAGRIYVITNVNLATSLKLLYLDISSQVRSSNEFGLKGIAFHPGYATNGYVFVTYCTTQNTARLSRFTRQAGNPDALDPTSEVCFIDQPNDGLIHNIDEAQFGPDGYLYVGFGDEGQANDGQTNSQTITKDFWSSIIRIDPDKRPGNLEPNPHVGVRTNAAGLAYYSVPADNPFVGATQFNGVAVNPAQVRTEFYAVGFRNPWQFSFDELTHELWVGEVGDHNWEEIDVMPAGGNAGWAFYEGNHPGPRTAPPGFSYVPPVWEYPHGDLGSAICGGLVLRGNVYPELNGKYICADIIKGNIWAIQRSTPTTIVERIAGTDANPVQFGKDPSNGELLMVGYGVGKIMRLVIDTSSNAFPQSLSAAGVFADLSDLSPNPGVVPYAVNLTFWSDYAAKRRWFALPDLTNGFGFAKEESWPTPPGMLWIKHFDMDLDRGNTNTRKRIETRVLMRTTNGAYGVSYRWNDAGTEAYLVADAGDNFDLAITNAGVPAIQHWRIPSRAECLFCHSAESGYPLSFNTRQLNATGQLSGISGNFIELLAAAGYFTNAIEDPNTLPRHLRPDETSYSLEARARSYLAVNCSYCHRGATSIQGVWDGRAAVRLENTGLIRVPAGDNGGDTNNLLIVPGVPAHSIIWNRIAATNGFTRMPPLATSEKDPSGIQLVADWIVQELPGWQTYAAWRLAFFGSTNSVDGNPDADPDGDGSNNQEEFLTYSNPTNSSSYWQGGIGLNSSGVEINYSLFNRSVLIEKSPDLVQWSPWSTVGNNGLAASSGQVIRLNAPEPDGKAFYRFRLEER